MEGGSFTQESDSNRNLIATGHGNENVEPADGIGDAPSECGPSPSSQEEEESPNGTTFTSQCSTSVENGKIPHHDPLLPQAVQSHEDERRGSAEYLTQPGAVAMAGAKEGNPSTSMGHQDSQREHPNLVCKQTGTVVIGMDRGNAFSRTTEQRIPNRYDDARVNQQHASIKTISNPVECPQQENFGSTIVEAVLISPPVEAVPVSIDEDRTVVVSHYHPFELEQALSREHSDGGRAKISRTSLWLALALMIMTAVCATMIPYTIRKKAGSDEAAPALPYDCYRTLQDILLAQIADDSVEAPTYIICPNTEIKIGTLSNPALDDYRYINGDYPIVVVRENVRIQCGLDGKRSNNCVVGAGFLHVVSIQLIPLPDGSMYTVNRTNDNLLIRGITFTGILLNVEPFAGSSISLSHPGRNMRFEDCLWYNITAPSGLIDISRNYLQEFVGLLLEDLSIEVTFVDCIFQSITYDTPLIFVGEQSVHLERCVFQDIQISLVAQGYCRYKQSSGIGSTVSGQLVKTDRGCASLLLCAFQSRCSIRDVCVSGMEIWGEGIIVIKDDSSFNHEGVYWESPSGRRTMNATCEVATIAGPGWTNFTCSDINDQPSCPLVP